MLGWFARDPTPVLTGPRIVLRAPRGRDFEAWRALRRSSRDFLKPFEPRWTEADLEPPGRLPVSRIVPRSRRGASRGTDYSFLIFETDGRAALKRLVGGFDPLQHPPPRRAIRQSRLLDGRGVRWSWTDVRKRGPVITACRSFSIRWACTACTLRSCRNNVASRRVLWEKRIQGRGVRRKLPADRRQMGRSRALCLDPRAVGRPR